MQLRMSPGGITPRSSRNRPELPPSSVTVTMTDRLPGPFLRPRSRVDRPVPPPMETILGLGDFKVLLIGRGYQIFKGLLFGEDREIMILQSLEAVFGAVMNRLFQVMQGLIAIAL